MKTALLVLIIAISGCFVPKVSAQSSAKVSGLTVIPSLVQLDLNKSKPEVEITYKNTTDSQIILELEVRDFTFLEDGYRLSILNQKDAENYKYSLSPWVTFDSKNIVLEPGQEKKARIFINSEELSPGGHYATIQAQVQQDTQEDHISVKTVLSSLLFVRAATGSEHEEALVQNFEYSHKGIFTLPENYSFKFHNTGNVDLSPYGSVVVTNSLGKQIGKGILNESSLTTMPESTRSYSILFKPDKGLISPGFYTANLRVRYGQSEQMIEKKISFFVIGDTRIAAFFLVVLLVLIAGTMTFIKKLVHRKL